jgi:tetratricopeptide (TPR) repeat protein
VLSRDPRRPGIHYRIGRVLLARSQKSGSAQDVQEAAKEFKDELELNPNANAAYELAEIDRGTGQLEEAQKYFELALKGHPDFEDAQLGLAATLLALQKADAALPHLQKAIALNRDNEVAWWRLAQVERALGDSAEQKKSLAEFQRLHSESSGREESANQLFSPDEVTKQRVDSNEHQ